jgi:hypothetical protein
MDCWKAVDGLSEGILELADKSMVKTNPNVLLARIKSAKDRR